MSCARREAGPPEPDAAPCGRARKLLSPSSGPTGGQGAAPAVSRRAASPWRRLALLPALALLLGALGLFAAAPASADVLVSNIAQTQTFQVELRAQTNARAQQFTTGTGWGYTLSSIDIKFHTAVGTPANLRVELWSALTAGNPNKKLADLTVPATVGTGAVTFAAPASTVLNGRTKYFVVVYRSGATTGQLAKASSDAEDTGAAAGWSIANGDHRIPTGVTSWTPGQSSLQIRVNGRTVPSLGRAGSMSVDGFHPMGPGRMKIAEGTSITYGIVIHQPPTADLTITPRHHNVRPDGSDYPNVDNSLLTIHNAVTWKAAPHPNYLSGDWQQAKSVGLTAVDDNECKSPPGTRYWIRHHGSGGGPDWGGWDRQDRHHGLVISIEIIDDDCKYLAASPGQVSPEEGASATYTVRLKTPLEDAAYISPRISVPGDSDPDAITVSPERIRVEAGDTSPQTFTVSAGRDANSRNEVLIVDHSVDSPEVPADYLGARVTVIVQDEQNAARTHERDALSVTGLALTAGSGAVALSPAFSTDVLSYRAEVPAGTARVTLAPHWSGGASVFAGSRRGGTTFTRPSRVRPSGMAVALALAPDGGATELWVMASGGSGGMTTYRIEVTEAAPPQTAETPVERTPPEEEKPQTVAVEFSNVPAEHAGRTPFALDVQSGSEPAADAFTVTNGTVTGVESLDPVLWRVRVKPNSWKDVTVALGGASATVPGPARIRVDDARAKEGKDAALDFAVTLNRAAAHEVSVDYATKDGTAAAGADYTAASGTLTFAPGETAKTVSVALLDDAIDEGKETFVLRLSNPRGAYLRKTHRQAKGIIKNDDPLQAMWLARFGRMVASDAVKTVTGRLETPRTAGSHLTFAGQRLDLSGEGAGDGAALANAMTGLARAFGAEVTQATDDGPFAGHGPSNGWNGSTTTTAPHAMTGRELLLGTSFRAVLGQGAGSQWTSWGQGASVSQFSAAVPGLSLTGESATGSMGMDYERGRLLAGFAMTHSVGEGTAHDAEWRYSLGSTATMMVPYGRFALTERISAWGMAGTGAGQLTLDLDGAVAQRYRTDLAMTLAAAGVRGELLTPTEPDGFALALKADAFWVRTESDRVTASRFGGLMDARGESSRVRAMLDGSRTFSFAGGATLAPSVELGLRHDGGDAETGTGLEFGAGLGYADPSRGLDMALRVHGLAVHAEDGYDEWGVSGQLRFVPGGSGRGLSASLTPSFGVDPGGTERLWALPDAQPLAANGEATPSSRLDTELGYGLAVFGGGFTGTPNVGLGLSDTARDLRLGWRLTPAAAGDTGFELSVDATRREAGGEDAEHGVMLRSRLRW